MQKFYFKQVEDGTYAVTGYEGDERNVIIPGNYGKGITILGDKLFSGHSEITSVQIPDTVTDIGEFVFDGCVNLRYIELPSQLKCLWGYTFVRCGIEEIVLPDQLKTLPPFAFKNCKNLKKVVCGKGLKKIHSCAFSGCDNLKDLIHRPEVEISPKAFEEVEK